MASKKIRVNTNNSKVLNGRLFISLLKAQQITSKVLKEKINYHINVTLDKKYVQYSGSIVDNGIRKLS